MKDSKEFDKIIEGIINSFESLVWNFIAKKGIGVNSTLSSVIYDEVYESKTEPTSGSLSIIWKLIAPSSGIRSGEYTLSCSWKIERLRLLVISVISKSSPFYPINLMQELLYSVDGEAPLLA